MIRSAKMNATTPPKLMPPFHSTAASGTLPIEQTNASDRDQRADERPPQLAASVGWSVRKKRLPERVRHPGGDGAGDQQAEDDVAQDRGPLHHEDSGETEVSPRRENRRCAETIPRACTDMSIAAWPSMEPATPRSAWLAGFVDQPGAQEQPEQHRQQRRS